MHEAFPPAIIACTSCPNILIRTTTTIGTKTFTPSKIIMSERNVTNPVEVASLNHPAMNGLNEWMVCSAVALTISSQDVEEAGFCSWPRSYWAIPPSLVYFLQLMNGQAAVPATEAITEVAVLSVSQAFNRKKHYTVRPSKTAPCHWSWVHPTQQVQSTLEPFGLGSIRL